jgi:hypothetical protein
MMLLNWARKSRKKERRSKMNRRNALKTMAVASIAVPFSILNQQVVQADSIRLHGYTYEKQVKLGNDIWNIYTKTELVPQTPPLPHPETFDFYLPCDPVLTVKRLGVHEKSKKIRQFPDILA